MGAGGLGLGVGARGDGCAGFGVGCGGPGGGGFNAAARMSITPFFATMSFLSISTPWTLTTLVGLRVTATGGPASVTMLCDGFSAVDSMSPYAQ